VQLFEVQPTKRLALFAGRSNPELGEQIAEHLGMELGTISIVDFANGEIRARFGHSIRGCDVFILQTHASSEAGSVNDAIMEQLIMIDAAKRASAKRITAVVPFFGYARQDRKAMSREPISAKMMADMLTVAGADRVVSIDLHSGQIQGFFDVPVDHLTAMPILVEYLRSNAPKESVMVSPDTGRVKVAERFAKHLDFDVASIYKRRSKSKVNTVEALDIMGEVEGRYCVIVDDMIGTAGTICAAAEILKNHGATGVMAVATHGEFAGPAIDRIKNSVFDRVVVTNTIPIGPEKRCDKIEILSAAPIFATAVRAVFEDGSVSEIFDGENFG
jgi:ribose-phosphate pyrophosphokinase